MLTIIVSSVVGFVAGFLVFRNNAAKVASIEAKAKECCKAGK